MDTSKPGKGILASLEHGRTVPAPRARPVRWPTPAKVVGGSVLAGAALVWWMYAAPAPDARPVVPAVPHVTMSAPAAESMPQEPEAAATIVEERTLPVVKALAPAVPAVLVAQAKPQVPAAKPKNVRREAPRRPASVPVTPDSDVTLLSALVAHVDSSDVVEPRLVDSTAALLQRCRRVGGEEGRLCRARICAAREADDACRAE